MKFTYLKNRFRGDGITIWSERGIYIEIDKRILKLSNWDEVRELMYMLEDIVGEAVLTNRKANYGEKLVISPTDEGWLLRWNERVLTMSSSLLRALPAILRYFLKKYHKIMLDYKSFKLHEGFEIDIANTTYRSEGHSQL